MLPPVRAEIRPSVSGRGKLSKFHVDMNCQYLQRSATLAKLIALDSIQL